MPHAKLTTTKTPREGRRPGRLSRLLRYACALHAHELGLGEDFRAREWAGLKAKDQALILHWLARLQRKDGATAPKDAGGATGGGGL